MSEEAQAAQPAAAAAPEHPAVDSTQVLIDEGEAYLLKIEAEIKKGEGFASRELSLVKTKVEEALLWLSQHLSKLV